ncbi:MAG TPA: formyltransferase family protein [Acidimicrobiales bacterium]|nr:formyltransferase family protein [Acidimicrobiales bacterium]
MRTVLLANNALGMRVARFLEGRGELAGVVVHPVERRRAVEPEALAGVPCWVWPDGVEQVAAIGPECLLSVLFGFRLPAAWLAVASWRALNLHPGLLPYNAGANPNVWPIVDGTPAGTTLHVMTSAVDAGPVLAQREVPVLGADTAATLYDRLMTASFDLFTQVWPGVERLVPVDQAPGGTFHRVAELSTLDPTPDDFGLIDRLRARTFPPFGAEFERDGQRYSIRVEVEPLP